MRSKVSPTRDLNPRSTNWRSDNLPTDLIGQTLRYKDDPVNLMFTWEVVSKHTNLRMTVGIWVSLSPTWADCNLKMWGRIHISQGGRKEKGCPFSNFWLLVERVFLIAISWRPSFKLPDLDYFLLIIWTHVFMKAFTLISIHLVF